MKIDLVAKGIELTENLKSYIESKLEGFERHLKEVGEGEVDVVVTLTVEKHRNRNRVDIDVYLKTPGGGSLHAWEESNDIYKSLEFAIDDIERQLNRLKERRLEQRRLIQREKAKTQTEELAPASVAERERIIEEKLPVAKPMSVEDASIILVSEGRYFFPFRNSETGEINVIYRKKNGGYGLITP
jgi:putative sigma-54 modulation protein